MCGDCQKVSLIEACQLACSEMIKCWPTAMHYDKDTKFQVLIRLPSVEDVENFFSQIQSWDKA